MRIEEFEHAMDVDRPRLLLGFGAGEYLEIADDDAHALGRLQRVAQRLVHRRELSRRLRAGPLLQVSAMRPRLPTTTASGLLISWAMLADSMPTAAIRSA